MKRIVSPFLVGVLLVAVGAILSAVTTQSTRKVSFSGEVVESTRIFDLGTINEGDKVQLAFLTWAEQPGLSNVLITLMKSDTKEAIPTSIKERATPFQYLVLNESQSGYSVVEYLPPKTARYEFIVSWAYPNVEQEPVKLLLFDILIVSPIGTPYMLPGIGTVAAGILLIVVEFIKRRSAKTG